MTGFSQNTTATAAAAKKKLKKYYIKLSLALWMNIWMNLKNFKSISTNTYICLKYIGYETLNVGLIVKHWLLRKSKKKKSTINQHALN